MVDRLPPRRPSIAPPPGASRTSIAPIASRPSIVPPAVRLQGTVLIVDDSFTLLKRAQDRLQADGLTVRTHTRPELAADDLEGVDVVLVDFHMPGITGRDVVQRLRGAAKEGGLAPIFLLHTTDDRIAAGSKEMGFDGAVAQKGNFDLLAKQVAGALRLKKLSAKM
jgi:CheY-like chemotaxis protein